LKYRPVAVPEVKLSERPTPSHCPSKLILLNKESFYHSREDQKKHAATFWKFLASKDRFVVLEKFTQKLQNMAYNPSSDKLDDINMIESLSLKYLGVPLPFDLKAVGSRKTLVNIAWCPLFSSCGLMLGSKFGDFHAKMEEIVVRTLGHFELSSKHAVVFLDMVWYCKRLLPKNRSSATDSDAEVDAASDVCAATSSAFSHTSAHTSSATIATSSSADTSTSATATASFDSDSDVDDSDTCAATTSADPDAGATSVDADPDAGAASKAKNQECNFIIDDETGAFLVAIQVLALRIAGADIATCRFMSAAVKSAMSLLEIDSDTTAVNLWRISDHNLSKIFHQDTKIYYTPHSSKFIYDFGYVQKVIDGDVDSWSNTDFSTSFQSGIPDALFLDLLPRQIFSEVYLFATFFFGATDQFKVFGDAAFAAIRSNDAGLNLHVLLKGAPCFSDMCLSLLSLYGSQTADVKSGTVRAAIAPRLSTNIVQKYKENIKQKETADISPFVQQAVHLERCRSRGHNPFIPLQYDSSFLEDFQSCLLLSRKLNLSQNVLTTIKGRLMRNAKTLQRGRNGEIIQEIQLALEHSRKPSQPHFKVLLLAFATRDAPAINQKLKSQSFRNFVVVLALCEVEKVEEACDENQFIVKSILLVSGMVDGRKTSSLNQQSILHMYLYRKFFAPDSICFFDPATSKMSFIEDPRLHTLLVSNLIHVVSCHEMKKWPKVDSIYNAERMMENVLNCRISLEFKLQRRNFVELSRSALNLGFHNRLLPTACFDSLATFDTLKMTKKAYNLKKITLADVIDIFESSNGISSGFATVLGKLVLENGDLFLHVVTRNDDGSTVVAQTTVISCKLCLEGFYSKLDLSHTISISDYTAKFFEINQGNQSKIRNFTIGLKNGQLAVKNFRHVTISDFEEAAPKVRSVNKFNLLYNKSTVSPTIMPSEMLQIRSLIRKANQAKGFAFNSKSSYCPNMKFTIDSDNQELHNMMEMSRNLKNEVIKLFIHSHLFGQILSFAAEQALSFDYTLSSRLSCSFVDENSLKLAIDIFDMNGQKREHRSIQDSDILMEWEPLLLNHALSNCIWDSDRLSEVLSVIQNFVRTSTEEDKKKFIPLLKKKGVDSQYLLGFLALLISLNDESLARNLQPVNENFQNVEADQVNGIYFELNDGNVYGYSLKEVKNKYLADQ